MVFWKMAYENKWATEEQLKEAVIYGELTEDQFLEIIKEK